MFELIKAANANRTAYVVERGKGEDAAQVTVDLAALSDEILAQLVLHGLKQKIADAAAGAKGFAEEHEMTVAEAAENLMQKVVDNLAAGNWGAQRGGAGVALTGEGSEVDAKVISLLRPNVRAADEKWYKNATEADRKARCVETFTALDDAQQTSFVKVAKARIAREREEAAELAAIAIDV